MPYALSFGRLAQAVSLHTSRRASFVPRESFRVPYRAGRCRMASRARLGVPDIAAGGLYWTASWYLGVAQERRARGARRDIVCSGSSKRNAGAVGDVGGGRVDHLRCASSLGHRHPPCIPSHSRHALARVCGRKESGAGKRIPFHINVVMARAAQGR